MCGMKGQFQTRDGCRHPPAIARKSANFTCPRIAPDARRATNLLRILGQP